MNTASTPLPLSGCVVCSSGLSSKARAAMASMTSSLGGKYVHNLSKLTTHLIVGGDGVASEKHRVAISSGIPCVTEQWLMDCNKRAVKCSTDNYLTFCFLAGLVVCVTGEDLSNEERNGLANLVKEGGGRFSADMQGGVGTLSTSAYYG